MEADRTQASHRVSASPWALIALVLVALTGCVSFPQRVPVGDRAMADHRECKRIEDTDRRELFRAKNVEVIPVGEVPHFYAACMIARKHVALVDFVLRDRMGDTEFRPGWGHALVFNVRTARVIPYDSVRADIAACKVAVDQSVLATHSALRITREFVSVLSFGVLNVMEPKYRAAFTACMEPRGYVLGEGANAVD